MITNKTINQKIREGKIKVGILCAGDEEVAPFLPLLNNCKLTEKAMLKFYEGQIDGLEVVTLFSGVCKTFSANAIAKFLKSEGRSLSVEAVYNYLSWLEKAFVIYRCQRYDLQGKSVLKTQEKFYLADPSLKYCIMGFNPKSIAAMLENIVYFELRRRGYHVYIGKNETKEIDFVAVQRDERIYVQVCRRLPEESDREVSNLLEIKDHYPKYVVTLDELATGNINGVKIVHLADFLLSREY